MTGMTRTVTAATRKVKSRIVGVVKEGSFPSEKFVVHYYVRLPCYALYNCAGIGICTPLNTCACATGFFGKSCNTTLLVIDQIELNFATIALPKKLEVSSGSTGTFALTMHIVTTQAMQLSLLQLWSTIPEVFRPDQPL